VTAPCQMLGCDAPAEVRRVRVRLRPYAEDRTCGGGSTEAVYVGEQCAEHWAETVARLGQAKVEA
jgi:hypothetical protein